MHRSAPRPSMILVGAALVLAAATAGCSSPAKNKLLVADATGSSTDGVEVWAVSPGDELGDDHLVIAAATRPQSIATRLDDGTSWVNDLGRDWSGAALLSYADASTGNLTTAVPGEEPTSLVESSGLQTTVLRRGVYVRTADGCVLATSTTETEVLGSGSCSISSDERWVVSWPSGAEDDTSLTIRDLRHDSTEEVEGLGTVVNAVVLAKDARIFAVIETADGDQGVVLDATDGSEIGRTEIYPYLDVTTLGAEATGFVILTSEGGNTNHLSFVDTDADVAEIESGFYLVPVSNGAEVTYLSYSEDLAESSVREWSPGDDEPETLITGQVGAGTADGELVIVREVSAEENASGGAPTPPHAAPDDDSDDSDDSDEESDDTPTGATVEFWRPAGHELRRVLTVPTPEGSTPVSEGGTGASVSTMWVKGHTAYLQLDQIGMPDETATNTTPFNSFVRIDLTGDDSDVPVQNAPGLLLESIDADGTALLTIPHVDTGKERVLVVGPHDDGPVTRGTFARTGVNLIHEGVIYLTSIGGSQDAPEVSVHSIRATGDEEPELLWKDTQIAGATWPEQNGATSSAITTVAGIIAEQEAAQTQTQTQTQTQAQPSAGG